MQPRIDTAKVAPGVYKAMTGLETYLHQSGLENSSLSPHKIAGFTNQRLRILHRHALERSAGHRRKRAASLWARRLARIAALL